MIFKAVLLNIFMVFIDVKCTLVFSSCLLLQGAGRRLHGVIDVKLLLAWLDIRGHSKDPLHLRTHIDHPPSP